MSWPPEHGQTSRCVTQDIKTILILCTGFSWSTEPRDLQLSLPTAPSKDTPESSHHGSQEATRRAQRESFRYGTNPVVLETTVPRDSLGELHPSLGILGRAKARMPRKYAHGAYDAQFTWQSLPRWCWSLRSDLISRPTAGRGQ